MSSKSKEARLEQRRVLEKKLDLRLSKLADLGVAKEKAKSDPLVKKLQAQIQETNLRIAAIDKNAEKVLAMKQAKEKKLAEKLAPKVEQEAQEKEAKTKKKPAAEKEPKKKPAEGDAQKKPRKKKEEAPAQ